jgi:hypothetical protein
MLEQAMDDSDLSQRIQMMIVGYLRDHDISSAQLAHNIIKEVRRHDHEQT